MYSQKNLLKWLKIFEEKKNTFNSFLINWIIIIFIELILTLF